MALKDIEAEINGQRVKVRADIPDGATPDQIQAAVGEYVKKNPPASKSASRPQESLPQQIATDASLGWHLGMAHLAHTASNITAPFSRQTTESLRAYEQKEAPKAEELKGREGLVSQVAQGVGELVPGLIEYAPALTARRYAPIAAGVIGAIGAADKGGWEAAEAGAETAVSWELMNRAQRYPSRTIRALYSGAGNAATAYVMGGSKNAPAAFILGAGIGAIAPRGEQKAKIKASEDSIIDDAKKILAPTSRGAGAEKMAGFLRPMLGERLRRVTQVEHKVRAARNLFDSIKENPANPGGISDLALDFYDNVEGQTPKKIADPTLRDVVPVLRDAYDQRFRQIKDAGLEIEYTLGYLSRLYKNPKNAERAYGELLAKKPIEGGKGFSKRRTFVTLRDALDWGKANPEYPLELISNNPMDVVMLGLREQDKFITGMETTRMMIDEGLLVKPSVPGHAPAGMTRLRERIPVVETNPKTGKKSITAGEWYGPSDAVQVLNNHLSPGMTGKPWFRAYSMVANAANFFTLAWSGFHVGFTTNEAMYSQLSLALEKAVEGARTRNSAMFKSAGKTAASSLAVPFEWAGKSLIKQVTKTDKLMESYISDKEKYPELAPLRDAIVAAGGGIEQDPLYRLQFSRQFKRAWVNARPMGMLMNAIPALAEKPASFIMDRIVPMQKIGAFHRLASWELEKLGPNASDADIHKAFQKSWDTVDNRFGQVLYDNLFWNKMARDLLHISVRSVGWNMGTYREVGGGIKDWVKFAHDAASGKRGKDLEFTHRMAYTVTMPIAAGFVNGVITYLNTGKPPQSMQDYVYPNTGRKDENGEPIRMLSPTYLSRDIASIWRKSGEDAEDYVKRLGSVALGKLNPLESIGIAIAPGSNTSWDRTQIRNSDDEPVKQLYDTAKYVAEQVIPFGFKYSLEDWWESRHKGTTPKYSAAQGIGAMLGYTPTGATVNRRPYEWAMDKYRHENATKSEKDAQKQQARRDITRELRLHGDKDEHYIELSKKAIDKGILTEHDLRMIEKQVSKATPARVLRFRALKMENALSVYFNYVMTDKTIPQDEKRELLGILAKKVTSKWGRIEARPDDDRDKIKYRNMLRVLHMLDENGEPQSPPDAEPDTEEDESGEQ